MPDALARGPLSKNTRNIYIALIVYTFCLLFFCSKMSPLYAFNEWVDVNAYFTMGKGMMNGHVLYKDLFDHKGPLLYFIYGLGYLIDKAGFTGVFLLQLLANFVTVIY
jgi:hypothetical protein